MDSNRVKEWLDRFWRRILPRDPPATPLTVLPKTVRLPTAASTRKKVRQMLGEPKGNATAIAWEEILRQLDSSIVKGDVAR